MPAPSRPSAVFPPRVIATTPRDPTAQDIAEATRAAAALQLPYCERGRASLAMLSEQENADAILVIGAKQRAIRLRERGAPLTFHCSAGVLRVRALLQGKTDPLIRALNVRQGDVVLDATAGQCADALVIAHAVGPTGRVIALESSAAIFAIIGWGVATQRRGELAIDAALDRIQPLHEDFRGYLSRMPPRSVDVVYFDPMFRTPAKSSNSFNTFRVVANPGALELQDIALAARVARRRVVVKDHKNAEELVRLDLPLFEDLRENTPIRFGVLVTGPGEDAGGAVLS